MVSHSKSGARRVKISWRGGGPRTFPGISSLKLVNRFQNPWYLQLLQYVRKIVTLVLTSVNEPRSKKDASRARAAATGAIPGPRPPNLLSPPI